MDIQKLLSGIDCSCGRRHVCDIKYVLTEQNSISKMGDICFCYGNILIIADENTYKAAGAQVEQAIGNKIANRLIFSGQTVLIPNEDAIATVRNNIEGADLIVGIGSGVIQDLCKYISFYDRIPYYIVATAPSMDGYASSGAAMITEGMKVTHSAKVPDAIIADPLVLKDAPLEMIKAGYGDIIGKYSALNDWKLSHIVNGEYFCRYIYDLTYAMLQKTIPLAEKLLERDEESIKTLTEALILVGIAMSFAGGSRPASGSEHHLSHYFEITGIINNEKYFPHGIDVVYSTVITSQIREKLASTKFPATQFSQDNTSYKSEINRTYKSVADGCIKLQEKLGTYGQDRITVYLENEDSIKKVLCESPTSKEIEAIIKKIGLDINEFYQTYGNARIADAVRYAKDLKDRYSVLWMYYDIFGLEEI